MKRSRTQHDSSFRAIEEHFWNLVGGSLVVGMLAGVIYLLVAMIASELYVNDSYWELTFFYKLFAFFLVFYLVLPKVFTALLGSVIGSSSGTKKRDF